MAVAMFHGPPDTTPRLNHGIAPLHRSYAFDDPKALSRFLSGEESEEEKETKNWTTVVKGAKRRPPTPIPDSRDSSPRPNLSQLPEAFADVFI
jgi:hypothetical protein